MENRRDGAIAALAPEKANRAFSSRIARARAAIFGVAITTFSVDVPRRVASQRVLKVASGDFQRFEIIGSCYEVNNLIGRLFG